MTICEKCLDKKCLKTKKPCEAVEKLLRKDKVFSRDYIRPRMKNGTQWREVPFSSLSGETRKRLGIDECFGKWNDWED